MDNKGGADSARVIPVSSVNDGKDAKKLGDSEDAGPRVDTKGRIISFTEVHTALQARGRFRHYNFWLKFFSCIISIIWNAASPIKSYLLSFYGLPGDDLVFSHNLNWTMQIDYNYAKALYDESGVKFTAPEGKPVRFINMYLDFVVFNRATKWAKYLDEFQQDPYVGQFCRTSLTPKGQGIVNEMTWYCYSGSWFAGNSLLEEKNCRVNEVSEAVMCLKGITALDLLNLEWESGFDSTDPYIIEGAQIYQDTVYPDLAGCLERREYLVGKLGRDNAMQQLAGEIAANYSLDPIGFAGKKGLYAEYRYYEGFIDLSGAKSGVRYSKMSGSLPERTQPIESDTNALVAGRERFWWLAGYTPKAFRDSVKGLSLYAPYMFIGFYMKSLAKTGRFVEAYSLKPSATIGACPTWNWAATSNKVYPDPMYVDSEPQGSVLTAYSLAFAVPRVLGDNNVSSEASIKTVRARMTSQCFARDGCLEECKPTQTGGWVTSFDRSGLCQTREVSQSLINRQGFVDRRCIGEGVGKDSFSVKFIQLVTRDDGSQFEFHQVHNIAQPGAIVACVLGGRIPQEGDEPYPNVFWDLIKNGPNTIVTTTFSRGTEKVLVNVYALVSLVGCFVFSIWVMQNLYALIKIFRRVKWGGLCDSRGSAQVMDSLFTLNLSTVAHGRNIQLSKVILWLNLVTWYIGAADSNCTWYVGDVDMWTEGFKLQTYDSPYYKCKPGLYFDHLKSLIGVVRLISISYNFYSLTCQHLILRGATRYARPFLSPILFFGVLPTFIASLTITLINHIRLDLGALSSLHNQLFLVMLWIAYLFGYHWMLQNETIGRVFVGILCKTRMCGKQRMKPGSVAEALIGPYYLTVPEFVREEPTEWVPLSVAMESPSFDFKQLDFTRRQYSFTKGGKYDSAKKPVDIPQWVLDDDEYLFC